MDRIPKAGELGIILGNSRRFNGHHRQVARWAPIVCVHQPVAEGGQWYAHLIRADATNVPMSGHYSIRPIGAITAALANEIPSVIAACDEQSGFMEPFKEDDSLDDLAELVQSDIVPSEIAAIVRSAASAPCRRGSTGCAHDDPLDRCAPCHARETKRLALEIDADPEDGAR